MAANCPIVFVLLLGIVDYSLQTGKQDLPAGTSIGIMRNKQTGTVYWLQSYEFLSAGEGDYSIRVPEEEVKKLAEGDEFAFYYKTTQTSDENKLVSRIVVSGATYVVFDGEPHDESDAAPTVYVTVNQQRSAKLAFKVTSETSGKQLGELRTPSNYAGEVYKNGEGSATYTKDSNGKSFCVIEL